jgi:hypothetical protein
MAAGTFAVGHEADFEFDYGGVHVLPSRGWSLPISGMTKAVHNTRDGRKRIAGLADVQGGSANLLFDEVFLPQPGMIGTGTFYTDKARDKFFELSIIIDSVGPAVDFEGEVVYPVTFSLESGTVTYPIYS